ncbi:MAG: hypothetical protein UT48_C0017G0019 [Parcubacteria group bacterium GW2011_GWE2_39_37]|uniref:GIY-YIG domain-containing protein n=1 Tax=Candidatus Falkowbacteria bacterium GW2011_GWF2_39_8 TaxID=1618642 RepID=A0A0G0SFA8_9BACT|nr:MAG: hypothetical protein UT48_C0017G0019 [Parcubacteria group bacterium GW2011_GWE2_39_37]KKR33390.1 MAG: hypothetical protein UT64_C0009G0002 [Candidatus Falkowbacteria bacterium GW2011_GWF2_39_8]
MLNRENYMQKIIQTESKKLNQSLTERLGYYVYLLKDPSTETIFYVGKGCGKRILAHEKDALCKIIKDNEKSRIIRKIKKTGKKVEEIILRHGMSSREAFEVESAMIDYLGKNNLVNIVSGHHSQGRGIMTLQELNAKYKAVAAEFQEEVLLININNSFKRGMSNDDLYEVTRKHWRVSKKNVDKIKIVCAVYRGLIREVFNVEKWCVSPASRKGRCYFIGKPAGKKIRQKYLNKSVIKYWPKGVATPVRYAS